MAVPYCREDPPPTVFDFLQHLQQTEKEWTMILVYGLDGCPADMKAKLDIEICQAEVQYRGLYRQVQVVDEAASVVYSYMHGIWTMIPRTKQAIRAVLLDASSCSGNDQRAHIFSYCPVPQLEETEQSEQMEDVRAGHVKLNSTLLSGNPDSCDSNELWVENLFHTFRTSDPNFVLYDKEGRTD
ncbi:hypothetical protein AAF712_011620 [Marasmius tenuissimus]|uniref:Uncharacterized protein n=1 Tax=Marasmius tenuissimus TaxID=585030 RepID=A0ABR2ZLD6_9AGAR